MMYRALLEAADQGTPAARDQLHRLLLLALRRTVSDRDYGHHKELVEFELALVDVMHRHRDPYSIALRVATVAAL